MKINRGKTDKGWQWDDYAMLPAALTVEIVTHLNQEIVHPKMTKQAAAIVSWRARVAGQGYSGSNVYDLVKFFDEVYNLTGQRVILFVPELDTLQYFLKHEKTEIFDINGRGAGVLRVKSVELRDPKFLFKDWEKINPVEDDLLCTYGFAEWYWTAVVDKNFAPLTTQQVIKRKMKDRMTFPDKCLVQDLIPYYKSTYIEDMTHLLMGAYSDALETEELNEPIGHVDFKTSYGARLMLDYFPMSPFEPIELDLDMTLKEALTHYCCRIKCTLYGVEASPIRFLSKRRAISYENAEFDDLNRFKSADKLTILVTELDFALLKKLYKFKSITIDDICIANRGPLPAYVRDTVAECYAGKEAYPKGSVERSWYKELTEMCNGACIKSVYGLDDGKWSEIKKTKMYLSPYWGIWCMAHARYELLRIAMQMGNDFIYAHTDSIYFTNPVFHVDLIEEYNKNQENKIYRYCMEHGLDFSVYQNLGKFEYEDGADAYSPTIIRFLANGPSRYCYTYINEHHEHEVVIKAGGYAKQWLKDGKLVNIWEYIFDNEDDVYANFNDDFKVTDIIRHVEPKDGPCMLVHNGKVYSSPSYALVYYEKTHTSYKERLVEAREAQAMLAGKQIELGKEQRIELI